MHYAPTPIHNPHALDTEWSRKKRTQTNQNRSKNNNNDKILRSMWADSVPTNTNIWHECMLLLGASLVLTIESGCTRTSDLARFSAVWKCNARCMWSTIFGVIGRYWQFAIQFLFLYRTRIPLYPASTSYFSVDPLSTSSHNKNYRITSIYYILFQTRCTEYFVVVCTMLCTIFGYIQTAYEYEWRSI